MDEYESYEPYENDLEELGNREAWEDSQAEMASEEADYDADHYEWEADLVSDSDLWD